MYKKLLFCVSLMVLMGLMACQNQPVLKNNLDLIIRLSPDSTAVMVKNLPSELLSDFKADSLDTIFCKQFFAVYPEIADQDLRDLQKPLSGIYQLRDSALYFTPTTPFAKGRAYFVQVYARKLQLNASELLKNEAWRNKTKPLEYKFSY